MTASKAAIDNFYELVTGEEDARVCKDIPEEACKDQPTNFFAYLLANFLTKIGDELSSAKLILPWLLSALGAPATLTGFLVPIRESGALLPQLLVAAYIRQLPKRKGVWIAGSVLQAVAMFAMALVALTLTGAPAGWAVLGLLALFSLARGMCSVSAKDVLGKTVSKTRRGTLMGYSAAAAGLATLGIGFYIQLSAERFQTTGLFFALLAGAAGLWLLAAGVFVLVREQPGATEGGGNALTAAIASLGVLRTDSDFRRFVAARSMLLGIALAPPFYVMLAQQQTEGALSGLGLLIIANGLAGSISAPVWGRLGDRSSRLVMTFAAALAGLTGIVLWALLSLDVPLMHNAYTYAGFILVLTVAHGGVRLGRKVYLVDMATAATRATYIAVSNTVIGAAMLAGGVIGAIGDLFDVRSIILALALVTLVAAGYCARLREVSN